MIKIYDDKNQDHLIRLFMGEPIKIGETEYKAEIQYFC